MAKTAALNKNGNGNGNSSQVSDDDKAAPRTSPFMRRITREMIIEPSPLDFIDGMNSREFALERSCRAILRDRFESQREWLDFAQEMWDWELGTTDRENAVKVAGLIAKVRSILFQKAGNEKVVEEFKRKLTSELGLSVPGEPKSKGFAKAAS